MSLIDVGVIGAASDSDDRCASISNFVSNLTSTYIDESNEASMVSGSVLMFILAGMFFNLNLFSGISDVSAILNPTVRLILSSALSLLLPVMSYLFSEAKNGEARLTSSGTATTAAAHQQTDLTLQAGIILVWMLLVELLRKKVDAIRMQQGFSGTLQRAGRVVWLGSLVFVNIHSSGRRIVYGILWIFCATTFVQRLAFNEFEKRSFARGKNARLIAYYMAHILGQHGHAAAQEQAQAASHAVAGDGDDDSADIEHAAPAHGGGPPELLLKKCRYIVMGEDHLVKEATADGYELNEGSTSVVTVGDVWRLPDSDRRFAALDRDQRLRRLCLSFALFKLLRRRFEHHEPPSEEEARDSRDLLFKGLYNSTPGGTAEAVFQVINDEVNFLSEYYHSVVPVIFASPFFLLANYLVLPVVVFGLCVLTVFLCGNGDVGYAVTSIHQDNSSLQAGIGNLTVCLIKDLTKSPASFFSLLDISITFLLLIIFLYESLWEIVVFVLSNWFMVSLVCNYTAKEEWCVAGKPIFKWAFHWIPCLRSWMSHGDLSFKQLSVLSPRFPPAAIVLPFIKLPILVPSSTVPACVKDSIMEYFVAHDHVVVPISSFSKSALGKMVGYDDDDMVFANLLSWAFDSKSIAEVILTWHIATDIFEEGSSPSHTTLSRNAAHFRMVATGLSRYCAYLAVFHPELLPDNQDKTERVVKLMKEELRESLGFLEFYCFGHAAKVKRIMQLKGEESWTENKVVKNGVTLGASLLEKFCDDDGGDRRRRLKMVWKMLANVWTELMAYLVPSTDEERLKGHENALVQGGDFITVLWALSTHTGISRQPV